MNPVPTAPATPSQLPLDDQFNLERLQRALNGICSTLNMLNMDPADCRVLLAYNNYQKQQTRLEELQLFITVDRTPGRERKPYTTHLPHLTAKLYLGFAD